MYPHNTVQPVVQQYRERSPTPYICIKKEGNSEEELYRKEQML